MERFEKLEILKLDLQRTGSALDTLLLHYLDKAAAKILETGIHLVPGDPGDDGLHIAYAAYLYRSRNPTDQGPETPVMPRSLQWELTNRLLHEKGRVGG